MASHDLCRQRKLHQVQIHGLRGSLSGGLLLRRREHARHPSGPGIDCGVCEPECPVDAIKPDTQPGLDKWLKLNAELADVWPNITVKRDPPADAPQWDKVPGKFDNHFSASPGLGD